MADVVNMNSARGFPFGPEEPSEKYACTMTPVGAALGMTGLGCSLTEVEPGKRAFPYHNHLGNDEMFVILEGTGTYRIGERTHPIKAGDVCGAPRGGPDTAHQIVNDGTTTLRYLAVSTKNDPEIVEYPETGKFAALAIAPGPDFMNAHMRFIGKREMGIGYWDGEEH